MTLRRLLATLVATAALFATAAATSAAPIARSVSVPLGDGNVVLPVPEGFADPSVTPETLRGIIAKALPDTNRFMAMMMSQEYLDRRAGGEAVPLTRYLLVQTYRGAEQAGMSADDFEQVKAMFRKQGGDILKSSRAMAQEGIDRAAKDVGDLTGDKSVSVKTGELTSLGVFDEQPNSISLASVQPITASNKNGSHSTNQVMALSIVRIGNKPVGVSVYSEFNSQADVDWAERQVTAWVKRLNELNR
jgi:hypothetical protein